MQNTDQPHPQPLNVALNSSIASSTSPTTADRPQPPANHAILLLAAMFNVAIQEKDIDELTAINHLYNKPWNPTWTSFFGTTPTSVPPDRPPWTSSTPTSPCLSHLFPTSAPKSQIQSHSNPPASAGFKPPKLVTDNWSCQSNDFYPLLSSILNRFPQTRSTIDASSILLLYSLHWTM